MFWQGITVRRARVLLATIAVLLGGTATAGAFDPAVEAINYSKIRERETYLTSTPAFQARMAQQDAQDTVDYPQIVAADRERDFTQNVCSHRQSECAGDVRFYDWDKDGRGLRQPVLFTARDGATISGNVWRTKAGPAKRPGVVITTGGLAPETLYWGFAATLARHGYVVLTYDVQGQGRSDTFGEGADRMEGRTGGPQAFASGQPFYDGTEDALDFLLSTPKRPYSPRRSCGNANNGVGTDHSAKQRRRVAAGLDAAYNPSWRRFDRKRIGIAGHSQGAGGVSFIGQKDPRVDAIVAWDHLEAPVDPPAECPTAPASRTDATITKPGLGLASDYHQPPEPYKADPDPQGKNEAFLAYKAAGVDSMQINIRGGTHYEFSFMAGAAASYPFGTATLRGYDLVAWHTAAWMDRYVKCRSAGCKRRAQARLVTDRWRDDTREGAVDPTRDPNMYSFYLRSRYALHRPSGRAVSCDDMRTGCASMSPDPLAPNYDLVADAFAR
jgi:dienelactone hydrolase